MICEKTYKLGDQTHKCRLHHGHERDHKCGVYPWCYFQWEQRTP